MEQYIKKSEVVAEIKRLLNVNSKFKTEYVGGKNFVLKQILSFLDTIETKEVDLEKEYEKYYEQERNIQTFKLAKHFFELGLNSQRKISYVPNIDDSLKELGVDPDSKEAKIFKESYYTALEKLKAQKEE